MIDKKNIKSEKDEYHFFIDLMKCLGVFLIINSHFDSIYPIRAFATGGALGNSLFFAASGFLIRNKKKDIKFFLRFAMRLYIPLWIITLLCGINHDKSYLYQLVWPTNYWFIGAIVLFYVLYTILEKYNIFNHIFLFLTVIIVVYFSVYIFLLDTSEWIVETPGLTDLNSGFKLIYYFAIMVFAGYVKECSFDSRAVLVSKIICILSVIIMYISKAIMWKYSFFMHFQFISQLCTFVFGISFLIICKSSKNLKCIKSKLINYISNISLECYLTQFLIISLVYSIKFPFNFVLAVVGIIVSAAVLKKVVNTLIQMVLRVGERINVKST